MEPKPFLKEVAAYLLQSGEGNLSDTCVVSPNKRARLYLNKYLAELTNKPLWAPGYFTISELMEELSGFIYADKLMLLFELFKAFKVATRSDESFDVFYPYSETLLVDFDEIDKYLVDADDLFGNLAGLKSIEDRFSYLSDAQIEIIKRFWNTFKPERFTAGQQTFLSLWEALPVVYKSFRNRMQSMGMAYEGMACRKVAEKIAAGELDDKLLGSKFVFVGFNAINKCEERLFRFLMNLGNTVFFWDYDSYYTSDKIHEAGYFMRKNITDFPQKITLPHAHLDKGDKKVMFAPVPSHAGQAAYLPFILDKLQVTNGKAAESTALVLADESLLIPVLYSIPEHFTDINVTMGYPIAGSPVYSLVDSLYQLNKNRRTTAGGEVSYHYQDVFSIMDNPLLKKSYGERFKEIRQVVLKKNQAYLFQYELVRNHPDGLFFGNAAFTGDAGNYLLGIIDFLIRQWLENDDEGRQMGQIQLETLYQIYTFLTRLQDLIQASAIHPDAQTLFRLIRKMLRSGHIPFTGEPLAGLQVLGILETRTLDFDNVIILSVNEGILPGKDQQISFIPYSMRSGFGLPLPVHRDSIYAYYFYRLIQRAKNVVLVYDNSTDGLKTGERSRFLHQLFYELPDKPEEIMLENSISRIPAKDISIEKKGRTAGKLLEYYTDTPKILSPSAINEFLDCSLRFYFHYLAGLPKPEEVTEDIDAQMFGNLLHKAMKALYTRIGQSEVTPVLLEGFLKNTDRIEDAINQAFKEELFHDTGEFPERKIEGYNLIIRHVIRKYIFQLLRRDIELGPFRLMGVEKICAAKMPMQIGGHHTELLVGGVVDRIDLYAGHIRIVDYKTGFIRSSFTTVESLFDARERLRNNAVFQVLLYAMVYEKLNPGSNPVPTLYFIRSSHDPDFSGHITYGTSRDILRSYADVKKDFEENLGLHLTRLFDGRDNFVQTENLEVCMNCPYAGICHR
jgi:hypothetical protein